jgi:hypothetical protein
LLKPCFQPNISYIAYAVDPIKTGIDKNPVPIIPTAKIVFAISTAFGNDLTSGSSALAA